MATITETMDYREAARGHLDEASALLADGGDVHLTYAILELRLAIEAAAYALLVRYRHEVGGSVVASWQPQKVLKELERIDPEPISRLDIELSADDFTTLGTEIRLSNKWVKENYHYLGNHLHMPTLTQRTGYARSDEVRERCHIIAADLARIVEPANWNFLIEPPVTLTCPGCEFIIKRRGRHCHPGARIECGSCNRDYLLDIVNGRPHLVPYGMEWTCIHCSTKNTQQIPERDEELVTECSNNDCREPVKLKKIWSMAQVPKAPGKHE